MNPYNVIIKPLLSEKSVSIRERESKYAFIVNNKAAKSDIKKAVELGFEVDVKSVNTMLTRGKVRRRGSRLSQSSLKKKAIVSLADGQKIKLFDDQ